MSRAQSLFILQELDTGLDQAQKRIQEIDLILQDSSLLDKAMEICQELEIIHAEKSASLKNAEHEVSLQNKKIEQNQKKLYGGAITNPKELEDLQLESNALGKYLQVLEERQLEAMLESDQSRSELEGASNRVAEVTHNREIQHKSLIEEKNRLESDIISLTDKRTRYINSMDLPDLPVYQALRERSGGLAIALMVDASCSSCGSNIPSAIEQSAKSPTNLEFCPTCKRILHPGY